MDERTRHLMERFPEHAEAIKSLNETNARFKDLIVDHHDVSDELTKMKRADEESEFERREELQRRRASLEEELILLMAGQQRP